MFSPFHFLHIFVHLSVIKVCGGNIIEKNWEPLVDIDRTDNEHFSIFIEVKGTLSGFRQYLVTKSSLKRMKNTFYYTLNDLFVLKIFRSLLFGHVEKRLD